ncbi:MAG TPA: hypothetical protein VF173_12530 [Thermoanaerobaculia bacterium]|nr:hypothetical protein [Thermoanaerobaculia bacterium]
MFQTKTMLVLVGLALMVVAIIGIFRTSRSVALTPKYDCEIHIAFQGHQKMISLSQALNTNDWPTFSNDLFSFTYPPDWKVSSIYSSSTAEYMAYIFPGDSSKSQFGTTIRTILKATTTPPEIRNEISLHTSLPIEQLSCTLAGMPASVFNVGDQNASYMLRVALFGGHTVSYLTLNEPGQAGPESFDAFRAILNSFAGPNL